MAAMQLIEDRLTACTDWRIRPAAFARLLSPSDTRAEEVNGPA